MSDESESASDPFAPPEVSTEVCCIHCGEMYDSWQIEWRVLKNEHGQEQGFWCCPIAGCDGMGFGFDILPTDPDYQDERGGWVEFDDDGEEEDDDDDDSEEWEEVDGVDIVSGEFPEGRPLESEIPWDDPEPRQPSDGKPALGDDWPFSLN